MRSFFNHKQYFGILFAFSQLCREILIQTRICDVVFNGPVLVFHSNKMDKAIHWNKRLSCLCDGLCDDGCFFSIHNRYFDIQRISSLFPCFAFGVFLKEYVENKLLVWRNEKSMRVLSIIIIVVCILFNLIIIRIMPKMHVAMTAFYGLNLKVAMAKWMMIIMRVIACTCLIIIFSDKEYWFTKYGSRTMNVYLLHAIPIFTICWGCLYNYRYDWYGLLSLFVLVPLLCTLFFSTPVNRFMKIILFSDYIKSIKNKINKLN